MSDETPPPFPTSTIAHLRAQPSSALVEELQPWHQVAYRRGARASSMAEAALRTVRHLTNGVIPTISICLIKRRSKRIVSTQLFYSAKDTINFSNCLKGKKKFKKNLKKRIRGLTEKIR